jgi:translation initiation factor IF-3
LSRPHPSRSFSHGPPQLRINGKIRAREVRVIGVDGQQVGVISLGEAIGMARTQGVDLVEIAPAATPPVCRLVDFGKFRYEQSKRERESKKHQHANKVKEIQLTATIDAHDFAIKSGHAVDFLCEEMKVKASLRLRGREMAHKEFGYQVMERLVKGLSPYGHPDAPPKLIGRSIHVMFSPLPRNKRARNPREQEGAEAPVDGLPASGPLVTPGENHRPSSVEEPPAAAASAPANPTPSPQGGFGNTPFSDLDGKLGAA